MDRIKEKYICPFTDFGFKKLFGIEPNKDLLIDFLNELLKNDEGRIQDLSYIPGEQLGRSQFDRKAVFDIYCENEKGEKFIVELQKAKQNYFKDRSIYYSTFPIVHQAQKGDWNFKLKSVYTVGILDFVFDEDKDDPAVFHHEVQLIDKKTQKIFYDKLTYIYLEMPKFTKTEEELETQFDKWLYVLRNLSDLTKRPAKLQERIFNKLFEQSEIARYTDEEYAEYEESLKVYRDLKNVIDAAFDEGEKEGMIKGMIKGKEEGVLEGKKERETEMIKNMYKSGLSHEVISEISSLSIEGIKKILK